MKKKTRAYLAPEMEVRKSLIRASILVGSDGAYNGTSTGNVGSIPGMSIEGARKRVNFEM